jgi:4,4'-diapophytoene synthase
MLASDRRYCRDVLPRVSRTFAINIRLLNGPLGESVRIGYLLCRAADALEDSWPGRPEEIRARFARFLDAIGGRRDAAEALAREAAPLSTSGSDLELVAHLPVVWRVFAALPADLRQPVAAGVTTLATGMSRYASRAAGRPAAASYLDTEAELHDYCYVVAGCVGVMLTRLFDALDRPDATLAAERERRAPAVGEALQLTNILLDWPSDVRRGRCHVPQAWLDEYYLTPATIVGDERPGLRELATRLDALARGALARVPDYLELIPNTNVRYRMFCLWPALWAKASLDHAQRDPRFPWGPSRPRLPRTSLWGAALGSLLGVHGSAELRAAPRPAP